jgi:enamine deaminase RidA (YjgF/YER057c/UK114 family)
MDAGSLDIVGDLQHQVELISSNFIKVIKEVSQVQDFEDQSFGDFAIRGTLYVTKEADLSIIDKVVGQMFDAKFLNEKLSIFEVEALPKGSPVELELLAQAVGEQTYQVFYG